MDSKELGGYELREVLGEGGMGTVYLAHDPTLDRPAAVKVIRKQAVSAEGAQRFIREARACSKISHPNIITVYAAGEDNGTPYMAMELIDGRTLRDVIKEGPVDWRTAVRWMLDILDALDRLHAEGIIHRDLKPENIMVTTGGVIKLMDFGLAHLGTQTAITQEGTTLGTVPYMSPEQVLGKSADARSDLFSLATILHEMVTGMHPFRGEHPMAVMFSIKTETPKPINLESQDFPPGLQSTLDRAFEKEVDKRYQNAGEFRRDLEACLPGVAESGPAPKSKTSVTMFAALAVIAVAAVIIAVWQMNRGPELNRDLAVQRNETGQTYLNVDDGAAEREFRAAAMADSTFALPWHNLAGLALKAKLYEEADSLFRRAARLDEAYPEPRFMLGVMAEGRGDIDEAARYYEASIQADSLFYAGYSNLAAIYLDNDRPEDARAILDTGLARHPKDSELGVYAYLLKNRGKVAAAMGDSTAAREYWTRAREHLADDAELEQLLGAEPGGSE